MQSRSFALYGLFTFYIATMVTPANAGFLNKLVDKWNSIGQISEKDYAAYPTVQEYFEHRFDKKRTITMNNVSYGAGTIMWDRAKQYCDRENGEFIQLKEHPTPLVPYRGAEILSSPNLQNYYGLFQCKKPSNSWKVYFDHENERIFPHPSPNTASDVSYNFE